MNHAGNNHILRQELWNDTKYANKNRAEKAPLWVKEGRTQQCSYRINPGCRHSHGGLPNKSKVKSIESIVQHLPRVQASAWMTTKIKIASLAKGFFGEIGLFPYRHLGWSWRRGADLWEVEGQDGTKVPQFWCRGIWNCGLNADNPGCCHGNGRYQMSLHWNCWTTRGLRARQAPLTWGITKRKKGTSTTSETVGTRVKPLTCFLFTHLCAPDNPSRATLRRGMARKTYIVISVFHKTKHVAPKLNLLWVASLEFVFVVLHKKSWISWICICWHSNVMNVLLHRWVLELGSHRLILPWIVWTIVG